MKHRSSVRTLMLMLAVAVTTPAAVLAEEEAGGRPGRHGNAALAENWVPPLGIPAPEFGIVQAAPPLPQPWNTAVPGFYYVEPGHPAATDSGNTYGTPALPRQSVPRNPPAGAVVEIRGAYTRSHTSPYGIQCAGTAERPVFIRGAAGTVLKGEWEIGGSYCIFEQLTFSGSGGTFLAPGHHLVLRDSEVIGTPDSGGWGVQTWGAGNLGHVVILRTRIHDNGDWQADFDQDVHGIGLYRASEAAGTVDHVWILDSELWHNSGDGVQVNGNSNEGRAKMHHIYLGGNVTHHNKQHGLWSKQASDVIFSENLSYAHRPSDSSYGAGMGFQYGPERAWFLFNHIHDCEFGIAVSGDDDDAAGRDSYYIGNVIHDVHSSGSFNPNTAWSNAALMLAGGTNRWIVNNTIHDVDSGIQSPGPGNLRIANNLISKITQAQGSHIFVEQPDAAAASTVDHGLFAGSVRIKWGSNRAVDLAAFRAANPAQGAGCSNADPRLVDPAADDLRIDASSPAMDAGVAHEVYGRFATLYGLDISADAAGTVRPSGAAFDLGAYEVSGDDLPRVSVTGVTVREGHSGTVSASFQVALTRTSAEPVTVEYATADETAVAGSDYDAASGTVRFPAGQRTASVSVTVRGDIDREADETFLLRLASPDNAALERAEARGTIDDDDDLAAKAELSSPAPGSRLASTSATFTWRTGASVSAYRLSIGSTPGGADLYNASQALRLSVTVPGLPADGRKLYVRLWSTIAGAEQYADYGYTALRAPATLSVADVSIREGSGVLSRAAFTVRLSAASTQPVSVRFATVNGTALAGSDFAGVSRLLSFAPGATSQTVLVPIVPDALGEHDETFAVQLRTPVGAGLGRASATGTIVNDDPRRAALTAPAAGAKLAGASATFTWERGFGVAEYRLEVVALNPLRTIHAASHGTSLQATVSTLPTDGSPLRVRLKSRIGSVWLVNVYSFTAARP